MCFQKCLGVLSEKKYIKIRKKIKRIKFYLFFKNNLIITTRHLNASTNNLSELEIYKNTHIHTKKNEKIN